MNETAHIKAAIATVVFEQREDLYQRTRNPLHVWHAFVIARRLGVDVPLWVLAYLDGVAGALTAPGGPRSPQAIADALGLATKGGPSKARLVKTDERDLDIVGRIWALQNFAKTYPDRDLGLTDNLGILQRVAEEFGLSLDRVQAIYHRAMRSDAPLDSADPASGGSGRGPTANLRRRTKVKPPTHRQARARRSRRTNS